MFLDFSPFLFCSHFFFPQTLSGGDTQAFDLNLCSAPIPVSVIWLQPFLYHSVAAVDSVHCLAGAVSPDGTSSSSKLESPSTLWWHPCMAWRVEWVCSSNILALSNLKCCLSKRSTILLSPLLWSLPIPPPKSSVIIIVYPYSSYRLWHSVYTYVLYNFLVKSFHVIVLYLQLNYEPSEHKPCLKLP